jgi:hypothetical protein
MKYPKLPPAFKQKWIDALRSGKYKQGRSLLHDPVKSTYCCLGVACRVAQTKIKEYEGYIEGDKRVPKILQGIETGSIPQILAVRNDSGRWNFNRIANWIEKNL